MVQHIKNATLAVLLFTLLLAGCTSKKALLSHKETIDTTALIAGFPAITPDTTALEHLSANIKLNLTANDNNIDLKGKLRIKRGEGVQISITPLGIVEAACIEFLPQYVRFINKMSKTYTEVPYSEASAIGLSGVNYNVLEAIFLNYAFLPDGRMAYKDLKEMKVDKQGDSYILSTGDKDEMQYSFLINEESGNLISLSGYSNTGECINCDYSAFTDTGAFIFPNEICIGFKGDATIDIDFKLNKVNNKPFKFSSRNVGSNYHKQGIDDFIKSIK